MTLKEGSNIWQMQARGDVQGILQALDSTDPQIRSRAVIALGALEATQALPKLRTLLAKEKNTARRQLLKQTIEKLAPPSPITDTTEASPEAEKPSRDVLLRQMRSRNIDEAEQAILALGKLGDRTVTEHLIIYFRNPANSPKLRLACAEALLSLESAPASVSLLSALRKPRWQVRRNAAAILGQLKADWAVDPLIDAMRSDPNASVRKTAFAALKHIRTPEAIQAIKRIVQEQSPPNQPLNGPTESID